MNCPHCSKVIPDDAKVCHHCCRSCDTKIHTRLRSAFYVAGLFVFLLAAYLAIRPNSGTPQTNVVMASAVHTSVVLKDETQTLRSKSWRSIPIDTLYSGNLAIDIHVLRGNPLDVALIPLDQMDKLRSSGSKDLPGDPNFSAVKTAAFHHSQAMSQGNYLLVFRDASLGILSTSPTNVAIKVTLNP
jgi:predicted nucleic acid-binding Zn ribbon protein